MNMSRVETALRIVRLVAERIDPMEPMSVGIIAEAMGKSLSSASRICSELADIGALERGGNYGAYRTGPRVVRLSGIAAAPVSQTVRHALTLAAQESGETVCLAAGPAESMTIIASVGTTWTLHAPAAVGERIPARRGAISRAAKDEGSSGEVDFVESSDTSRTEIACRVWGPGSGSIAVLAVCMPAFRGSRTRPRARAALERARLRIERAALQEKRDPVRESKCTVDTAAMSSLEVAFRVLEHFAAGPDSVTAAARTTDVNLGRVHRAIVAAVAAGVLDSAIDDSTFRISWVVHAWHRAAVLPVLTNQCAPLVARTAHATRSCSFITVLRGMSSVTLVEELQPVGADLAMIPWLGRPCLLTAADGGPTLVMDFSADELTALFRRRPDPWQGQFIERVRIVGRDGVLSKDSIEDAGLISVSAPIRDASGIVAAAACLVGTTVHMRPRRSEMERAAVDLADRASALLGFHTRPLSPPYDGVSEEMNAVSHP